MLAMPFPVPLHLRYCPHHCHRTDHVPLLSTTLGGSSTPAAHCTSSGASGCFCLYQGGKWPRMLTSGTAGASVNLSQQSCSVWWWASGSKQAGAPHQTNVLQGSWSNGPALGSVTVSTGTPVLIQTRNSTAATVTYLKDKSWNRCFARCLRCAASDHLRLPAIKPSGSNKSDMHRT